MGNLEKKAVKETGAVPVKQSSPVAVDVLFPNPVPLDLVLSALFAAAAPAAAVDEMAGHRTSHV